jgi:hypothetical protein
MADLNTYKYVDDFQYNLYYVLGMWCMLSHCFMDEQASSLLSAAINYELYVARLDPDMGKRTLEQTAELGSLILELIKQIDLSENALKTTARRMPFSSPDSSDWRRMVEDS